MKVVFSREFALLAVASLVVSSSAFAGTPWQASQAQAKLNDETYYFSNHESRDWDVESETVKVSDKQADGRYLVISYQCRRIRYAADAVGCYQPKEITRYFSDFPAGH